MKEHPSQPDKDGYQLVLRCAMESLHLQHNLKTVDMFSSLLEGRGPRRLSISLTPTRTSKRLAITTQRSPMTLTLRLAGCATSIKSSLVLRYPYLMMTRRIGVNFLCARLAS